MVEKRRSSQGKAREGKGGKGTRSSAWLVRLCSDVCLTGSPRDDDTNTFSSQLKVPLLLLLLLPSLLFNSVYKQVKADYMEEERERRRGKRGWLVPSFKEKALLVYYFSFVASGLR